MRSLHIGTLIMALACSLPSDNCLARPEPICVNFRLDDYSSGSGAEFDRAIAPFLRRHLPLTIGAIPFWNDVPLQGERADQLRAWMRDGGVEVTQHGYAHAHTGDSHLRNPGEFGGLDLSTQMRLIAKGRAQLETAVHAPITAFIPPWNGHDENTLHALEQLGFKVLSAGYDGAAPAARSPLRFAPFTALLAEYRSAIEAARTNARQGGPSAVIVLFHAYELTSGRPRTDAMYGVLGSFSYAELEDLLDWTQAQSDIAFCTLERIATRGWEGSPEGYRSQLAKYDRYIQGYARLFDLRKRLFPPRLISPRRDPLSHVLTFPLPEEGGKPGFGGTYRVVAPIVAASLSIYWAAFAAAATALAALAKARIGSRHVLIGACSGLPIVAAGLLIASRWATVGYFVMAAGLCAAATTIGLLLPRSLAR